MYTNVLYKQIYVRLCLLHTPKIKYAIFCKTFSHRGPVKELVNVFYIRKEDATMLVHLIFRD